VAGHVRPASSPLPNCELTSTRQTNTSLQHRLIRLKGAAAGLQLALGFRFNLGFGFGLGVKLRFDFGFGSRLGVKLGFGVYVGGGFP
jgi:hypothetical protein